MFSDCSVLGVLSVLNDCSVPGVSGVLSVFSDCSVSSVQVTVVSLVSSVTVVSPVFK